MGLTPTRAPLEAPTLQGRGACWRLTGRGRGVQARDERGAGPHLTESERIEVEALLGEMTERARRGLVSWAFLARFTTMLAEDMADRHERRQRERNT